MDLSQIEASMVAELSKPSQPSTQNQMRLLQQLYPACRDSILRVFNRYKNLCRSFAEGAMLRPAANEIIRTQFMNELLKEDVKSPDGTSSDLLNPVVDINDSSLLRYEVSRDKLVKAIDTGTAIAYVPIVPLCRPGLLIDKLRQRGIKSAKFETYVVLESQLVVGISNALLEQKLGAHSLLDSALSTLASEGKKCGKLAEKDRSEYIVAIKVLRTAAITLTEQLKSSKLISELNAALLSQKVSIKDDGSADVVASLVREVCKALSRMLEDTELMTSEDAVFAGLIKSASRTVGKKLIRVSRAISYLNARWFWLTTEKELNSILSSSMGNQCEITKWGLAFNGRADAAK